MERRNAPEGKPLAPRPPVAEHSPPRSRPRYPRRVRATRAKDRSARSISSRALAGRAALVLTSTAIAIAGAELVFRWETAPGAAPGGDDGWDARYRAMTETLYRRSDDPELVYEPVPLASIEMEYGRAAFNAASMRDDREPAREPGPRPRVAIVGDSLVWSEFVAVDDALPMRTEAALDGEVEVLGFGVSGYDTAQEAAWYERAVRPFAPRVVVVVYCMNDMMIMSGPFERFASEADRARKDAQEARFAAVPLRRETLDDVLRARERDATVRVLARAEGLFERWRFAAHYTDEYLLTFAHEPSRARTDRAIARLGAAIRRDGARALLVISPVLESWERYPWAPIHAHVRAVAERAGFAVLDPLDAWRGAHDPRELRIAGDNLHYGVGGNAVFGVAIASAIRDALDAQ